MATTRQKIAVKKVLENHGVVGRSMIEAGYSPNTAKNPKLLTDSKGWEELMAKHIGDKKLAEVHNKLLLKKETIIVRKGKESHVELTEQPHSDASKALDMAYKLKGRYAPEKSISLNVNANPDDLIKHKALRDEYEKKLLEEMKDVTS